MKDSEPEKHEFLLARYSTNVGIIEKQVQFLLKQEWLIID